MQNIFDFIINNKTVVISIFIFMCCVIIGFFGNRRLELKKKKVSSNNDIPKKDVDSQSTEIIDTLGANTNDNILMSNENINNINKELNDVQVSSVEQNSNGQGIYESNLNNSTITSNFSLPDDNDINNIF